MHAAIVYVTIDPAAADAARSALNDQVVPMVSAAPGFVAGYWLQAPEGQGFSMVLFESEEQARQTAPPVGSSPSAGVTIDRVDFWPVVAHA